MNNKVLRLAVTALMAALCYVAFTYLKIDIPTPSGHTAFHLGNTFCVLAALLLGGVTGGIAGAIGMGIGDVLNPKYIAVAPKTIILKLMIGIVAGTLAHKVFHITEKKGKELTFGVILSATGGMLFNVVCEPIFSYFYYGFILNIPEKAAKVFASWNAFSTSINAILAIIISSILYLALASRLRNNETLKKLKNSK